MPLQLLSIYYVLKNNNHYYEYDSDDVYQTTLPNKKVVVRPCPGQSDGFLKPWMSACYNMYNAILTVDHQPIALPGFGTGFIIKNQICHINFRTWALLHYTIDNNF